MDPFQDLDDLFAEFGLDAERPADERQTDKAALQDGGVEASEDWGDDGDEEGQDMERRRDEEIRRWANRENLATNMESDSGDSNDSDVAEASVKTLRCTCKTDCMRGLDEEEVEEHRLSLREMEKSEKEMFVMASLQKYTNEETRLGKRRRTRYRLMFNGRDVCKAVFLYVNDMGKKTLRNIIKHVSTNGAVPRIHGNKGRKPHNALKFNEVKFCVDFIIHHAQLFGIPMPAAPKGHDEAPPVYLPCSTTKRTLHEAYCAACKTAPIRHLGLSSFKGVWRQCCPHIRIMTPKDDVCHKCQLLKNKIADSVTDRDKLEATTSLKKHVEIASREKDVYKYDVRLAIAEVSGMELTENPVPPASTELKNVHYTFDYAQNVVIPHHSQQMGPLYFITCRKIQIFGVRHDSTGIQYNYLIDEDESIGPDGKNTHGPDAVISMLHDFLLRRGLGERKCTLSADNCAGQNKNRYVLAYLCWRIHRGLHEEIELKMRMPGHTKCLVDGGFGRIKQLYRRRDCDSLLQLAEIVDKSASTNRHVLFKKPNGEQNWEWFDWKSYLSRYFLAVKGIQKFHTFRVTAADKEAVFVREASNSDERRIKILKTAPIDDAYPAIVRPAGLTRERQMYLFKTVRPYVRPSHQDETCPRVDEE